MGEAGNKFSTLINQILWVFSRMGLPISALVAPHRGFREGLGGGGGVGGGGSIVVVMTLDIF